MNKRTSHVWRDIVLATLLQFLISATSNAAQPSQQEVQSLANAISASDSAAVLELLRQNTNLCNSAVWWTRRPLHVAVAKGWDEVVDFLLKNGADPDAEGDTWDTSNAQMTPLEAAIQYNHPDIFKRLLAARANPNHRSTFHGPALNEAFAHHHEEMAALLLDNGANPFLQDLSYRKRTPIEMAIIQSDGKLVSEMLKAPRIKKEVKVKFLAEHGSALLAEAAQRGELEAVEAMLAANVKPAENPQSLTLLQTLSQSFAEAKKSKGFDAERWMKIHELLQKNGCSDDAFSATGFGNLDAARNFFKTNPSVIQAKDNEGQSLLHWSVLTDQLPLTDFWLESRASPSVTNFLGQTPLHLAAARGLTNQVMRLLAANVPLDLKDANGMTAFDVAVQAKQTEVIQLLLEKNKPGAESKYGISTPLHHAAATGDISALTKALAATTNLEAHDELGLTPLQAAVMSGHLAAAVLLMDKGANINAPDPEGNTLLHQIFLKEITTVHDLPPTNWLDRVGQDPDKKIYAEYLIEPPFDTNSYYDLQHMHGWFVNTLPQALCFLLAGGIDVKATNNAGETALELVLNGKNSRDVFLSIGERPMILELLVSHGGDANRRDAGGNTILHRLSNVVDANEVDRLADSIASGANVNATNNLGQTPLHKAAEKIWGWDGNDPAVNEPFQLLVYKKANVNAQDNEGRTPLHVLATADTSLKNEAVKLLLDAGANPNLRDKHGRTPAHLFLSGEWPWSEASECIETLAKSGADLSAKDEDGKTPLHYLAALGEKSPMFFIHGIGDTLISAKADVQARDNEGDTPLHIAARTGTKDVYDWLIQHGASLDATNFAGQTPRQLALNSTNQFSPFRFNSDLGIYQAIREGKLESVTAILKSQPELLNKTNQSGETPLRAAAVSRRTNIVEYLAQQGAQWDEVSATIANRAEVLHDILARRPADATNFFYGGSLLHLAGEHDAENAAGTLIAAGADLKAQNIWGLSPLGDALLRHQTNIANLFLKHDAVENIFDAVYLGDFNTAKNLLAQDKSLAEATNKNHLALTLIAAATGHDKILGLLLDNGASLDSPNGTTPLHAAAIYNQTNTVALLIKLGAKMDAFDERGFTPLHLAVIQDSTETVALLLKHGFFKRGADPNIQTISPQGASPRPMPMMLHSMMSAGNSALHFAAMNADTKIIELLLQSGASINAANAAGMTPLDYAGPANFGPPISFWINRGFIFGPLDLFRAARNTPPISPTARQAAIDLLEKAGGKHGEHFQQNRMPRMMPGGLF
jgi:ankyrin repeat protein